MANPLKGRGTGDNREGRFESLHREAQEDGWWRDEEIRAPATEVRIEVARSIISRNRSPDIPFSQSINPYRGCEHGCIYCFARPSHAHLGLSPGLDFETKLFYKPNTAALLRAELSKPGYVPARIQLGANTDCYQPIEKKLRITREIIEVLSEFKHPLGITTKSHLVTRDIDLLAPSRPPPIQLINSPLELRIRPAGPDLSPTSPSRSIPATSQWSSP